MRRRDLGHHLARRPKLLATFELEGMREGLPLAPTGQIDPRLAFFCIGGSRRAW
jgi:hypothetical protein